MPSELLKTCYAERNPSTLYVKGVQFFFSFRLKEEGLSLMKLVRSVKWGWSLWHSDEFRQHRAMFISAYLPSFYHCQCANLVERQCLCLWHIDVTKDDNMCDRCFWIKETGMF
ncbi:hypothetical protein F2Q68_00034108 [Brassica cretica]|uniref:Uncharacterized protein n=1 Tax=Brassica cretica TaxID=69181 RepID=A0A8S9H7S8_BRACR|nr:hypothetical protein F2Q68_00034108 [Brassica cretica]